MKTPFNPWAGLVADAPPRAWAVLLGAPRLELRSGRAAPTLNEPGLWIAIGLVAALGLCAALAAWRDMRRIGYTPGLYAALWALRVYCRLWHRVRLEGPDPLPPSGPAIVISNHTSPSDPLFLQCATRRVISPLMAREYFGLRFLRPIFRLIGTIPVNRTGRDTAATKAALRAVREGRVIGIFPEGGIHLDPGTLGEPKPGAAMLALLTRAPVVPAFIDRRRHTNRLWNGLFERSEPRIAFGPPIDLSAFYGRRDDRETIDAVAKLMMDSIERLRPQRRVRRACLTRRGPARWVARPGTP